MLKKVDHVAILVRDIEEALKVYRDALGLPLARIQEVPEQQVKVASLPVGDCKIELIEPTTADSGVARFLEKRGEGLHHICFEVDDIEAALRDLAAKDLRPIDEKPRRGAMGRMAFVHPKSAHGVLIELVEKVTE